MHAIGAPVTGPVRLQRFLAAAGWEIDFLDLDLTTGNPTVDIRLTRADGRWISARVDSHGRCTVEFFQRAVVLGTHSDTKGRAPLSPRVIDTFIRRAKYPGPRAMLRGITHYLTDNALHPVALADMRSAWASVMGTPTYLPPGVLT